MKAVIFKIGYTATYAILKLSKDFIVLNGYTGEGKVTDKYSMKSLHFLINNWFVNLIMYTTEAIVNLLRSKKENLEKKYPLSELALFGSYARGDQNEESDIDILVDFNSPIDGYEYIRLAHELEDLFNQKIDMVSRQGIKSGYLPYVEKNLIHV
jgi:uncharacterized protein